MFLVVDYGKVLWSFANELQETPDAFSIDRFVIDSSCLYLTFVAFCLLSVIRKQ